MTSNYPRINILTPPVGTRSGAPIYAADISHEYKVMADCLRMAGDILEHGTEHLSPRVWETLDMMREAIIDGRLEITDA